MFDWETKSKKMKVCNTFRHHYEPVHQPRMKVFALGLDENQKADKAAAAGDDEKKVNLEDTKIPIETITASVPIPHGPQIVLAKAPKRRYGFTCGLFSWFIGAFCLVLLCLAISEVAYHRQRDQAFLRLKWAELRQRMLGYELLSQQQELDRMALEKNSQQTQQPIEALPLRRSDDPIKPKIVATIKGDDSEDAKVATNNQNSDSSSEYQEEQNLKFGFLQTLMDKIRKHAESMGLNGDMQVHVVEVKPIQAGVGFGKDSSEAQVFDQSMADGFGEYAMPHQDFSDDYETNNGNRRTFDRQSFRKPFFGPLNRWDSNNNNYDDTNLGDFYRNDQGFFGAGANGNFYFPASGPSILPNPPVPVLDFPLTQPQNQNQQWWQQPQEVETNQWSQNQNQNPNQAYYYYPQQFPQAAPAPTQQQPQQQQVFPSNNVNDGAARPWYMPYGEQQQQQQPQSQPIMWQNDDWMQKPSMPFQPNPQASFQAQQQSATKTKWIDQTAEFPSAVFSDNSEINNKAAAIGFDSVSNMNNNLNDPKSSLITMDNVPLVQEETPKTNMKAWIQSDEEQPSVNVISPDTQLESIEDNKFLPIRSDDKPIDSNDASSHLFQVDDPSSFKR